MSGILDNLRCGDCMEGERRNSIASVLAGVLVSTLCIYILHSLPSAGNFANNIYLKHYLIYYKQVLTNNPLLFLRLHIWVVI